MPKDLTDLQLLTELQPVGVESRPGVLVAYVMLVGTLQLDVR